jgi:hypothetical protein
LFIKIFKNPLYANETFAYNARDAKATVAKEKPVRMFLLDNNNLKIQGSLQMMSCELSLPELCFKLVIGVLGRA